MSDTLSLQEPSRARGVRGRDVREATTGEVVFLSQADFLRTLRLECKRAERSKRRFVLMLVSCDPERTGATSRAMIDRICFALTTATRETDIKGWYQDGSEIGVIFTEIGLSDVRSVSQALLPRIRESLKETQFRDIAVSFHVFPDDGNDGSCESPVGRALDPDFLGHAHLRRTTLILKRAMDIVGSLAALTALSPVLAIISVLVKSSSKGPILFRQERIGFRGERFTFLKFRSMYLSSDSAIHRDYVKRLINGSLDSNADGTQPSVYKITNDPRVTKVGRFLRRTSLDELPQFANVLLGQMSLVGPRPPVQYEFENYDLWHRRRLFGVKPGITGLWQVAGRSKVKFDDMVRLDLRYIRELSLWLDLKILWRTPRVVISGDGAF